MDQRAKPRFVADQSVAVTVLGGRSTPQTGRMKNASACGLAIETPGPISPGAAVKIEFEDSIVLGEAVYCRGGGEGYLIGVELDQVLCGLTELGKKLQEFAEGEPSRQIPT